MHTEDKSDCIINMPWPVTVFCILCGITLLHMAIGR
jgi:hypothetical protein